MDKFGVVSEWKIQFSVKNQNSATQFDRNAFDFYFLLDAFYFHACQFKHVAAVVEERLENSDAHVFSI